MPASKLTDEVRDKLVRAIEAGNYHEQAAQYAGISKETFYRWRRKGEAGEEPYASLLEELDAAEAKAEVLLTNAVSKAAISDWRAADMQRKRRWPDRWGDRIDVRVMDRAWEELLDVIRERADPETYERVLAILSSEGRDEALEGPVED